MTPRLVPPASVTADELSGLRTQVRDFLHEQIATGTFTPGVDTWLTRWDSDFSRALADRGWIGMTIPVEFGGHGRSFVERFVVTEELLAAGAPVAAHWVADRQGRSFKRLNELFAATGQVGFLASERVDGKLILPEAVKVLQQKAS